PAPGAAHIVLEIALPLARSGEAPSNRCPAWTRRSAGWFVREQTSRPLIDRPCIPKNDATETHRSRLSRGFRDGPGAAALPAVSRSPRSDVAARTPAHADGVSAGAVRGLGRAHQSAVADSPAGEGPAGRPRRQPT